MKERISQEGHVQEKAKEAKGRERPRKGKGLRRNKEQEGGVKGGKAVQGEKKLTNEKTPQGK